MTDAFAPLRRQQLFILLYPGALIALGVWLSDVIGQWLTAAGALLALYKTVEVLFFADALDISPLRRFLSAALAGEAIIALAAMLLPLRRNPDWIPIALVALAVFATSMLLDSGYLRSFLALTATVTLACSTLAFLDPLLVKEIGRKGNQSLSRIRETLSSWNPETSDLFNRATPMPPTPVRSGARTAPLPPLPSAEPPSPAPTPTPVRIKVPLEMRPGEQLLVVVSPGEQTAPLINRTPGCWFSTSDPSATLTVRVQFDSDDVKAFNRGLPKESRLRIERGG